MSRYLIDRIAAAPNIELLTRTEIVALSGTPEARLERVRWRNNVSGEETDKPIRNVFLFVGADPATDWLQECGVALDEKGFIRTVQIPTPPLGGEGKPPPRLPLEGNILGVLPGGGAG